MPADYVKITSGLGEAPPLNIMVLPVVFEGQVKAVMELASFDRFSPTHQTFLDQLTESIGIVLNTIEANMRTEDLLKQSQSLARELQSRQEELQQTNTELEEKAKLLAEQNVEVERKNTEVEQARQALEEKAKQLALTSKYKSEFLANMSHELRTPLNSLLILSDELSQNKDTNLTGKQVEFAKTIHSSGNDLLALINDILDLSKIESGTVVVDIGEVPFKELQDYVERTFRHIAESKKLEFYTSVEELLPRTVQTDPKRLQQVLKNLLSNSFKFTEKGRVSLDMGIAKSGWNPENNTLRNAKSVIYFSVSDTGIGIMPEKQSIIFEAFQQADGSTNRKYGGTGLGLAISREIARLLGGEIKLSSHPGEGSTFTLYLPNTYVPMLKQLRKAAPPTIDSAILLQDVTEPVAEIQEAEVQQVRIEDDKGLINPGDKTILIVENDLSFARYLLDTAHEHQLKGLIATRGIEALAMAREHRPSAITLDINLHDIDGWRVLYHLKDDFSTRHIPIHIISTEEDHERGLRMGAIGALAKPIKRKEILDEAFGKIREFLEPRQRKVLAVTGDEQKQQDVVNLVGAEDVTVQLSPSPNDAFELMKAERFDIIVLDAHFPKGASFELLERINNEGSMRDVPVIALTSSQLSKKDEAALKRYAQNMNVKDVRSAERLLDEVSLFLHRPIANLPEERRKMIEGIHASDTVLGGKSVLIVDDDIRNIFAMTSILERQKMHIFSAENGRDAIQVLRENPTIDVVLTDIMMPDMDGYDTMQAIRKVPKFRTLPVIALTAKAMKGDREKCIEAGASDYISKPVDTTQLISMLRLWLYR